MVGTRTREQQHGRRRRIYWAMAVPKDVSKQKWWQKIANRHSTFRQNVTFLFCTLRSFVPGQVVDVVFLFTYLCAPPTRRRLNNWCIFQRRLSFAVKSTVNKNWAAQPFRKTDVGTKSQRAEEPTSLFQLQCSVFYLNTNRRTLAIGECITEGLDLFGFDHKIKTVVYSTKANQLNPNNLNRRSAVRRYFPLNECSSSERFQ